MFADVKNRADWQVDATREASSGSTPMVPPFRALGRVRLDLSTPPSQTFRWEDEREVVSKIKGLECAPTGADVVLSVAPRQLWPGEGISFLREQCQHLGSVTVESSDPTTVRSWVLALRGGSW